PEPPSHVRSGRLEYWSGEEPARCGAGRAWPALRCGKHVARRASRSRGNGIPATSRHHGHGHAADSVVRGPWPSRASGRVPRRAGAVTAVAFLFPNQLVLAPSAATSPVRDHHDRRRLAKDTMRALERLRIERRKTLVEHE